MIAYIEGQILEVDGNRLVVNVNGVGYEVFATGKLAAQAQDVKQMGMMIQTEVREQSITLYGFADKQEKEMFKLLCNVPGMGPKTAMTLQTLSVEELRDAVFNEDLKKLTSIPGLGKKTAQRLILELNKKLPESMHEDRVHGGIDTQVYDALTNLGYARKQVDEVLKNIPSEIKDIEDVVRFFLKNV